MSGDDPDIAGDASRLTGAIAGGVGLAMHLVVGVFVFSTGLLAPAWAVVVLGVAWLLLLVGLWRWRHSRPLLALLVPFAAAGLWWVTVTAGERWLGWSA